MGQREILFEKISKGRRIILLTCAQWIHQETSIMGLIRVNGPKI